MFFRRLEFKIENDPQSFEKIWSKFNPDITVGEFGEWVREAKIDYRNYIRVPSVRRLFRAGSKAREQGKLLRVLFKLFLDEESISCYLTSRKIKKEAMPHNLLSVRSICTELFTEQQL